MGGGVYVDSAFSCGLLCFDGQRRKFYGYEYIERGKIRQRVCPKHYNGFNCDGDMPDFSVSFRLYDVANEFRYAKNNDDAYNASDVDEFSPAYPRLSVNA